MRICFAALSAAPLFLPELRESFGGMETRGALFARGLARKPGVEVSFLVSDTAVRRPQVIDGVRLVPYPNYAETVKQFQLYHEQIIWSQMRRKSGFPWVDVRGLSLSTPWHILMNWVGRRVLRSGILPWVSFAYTPPTRWIFRRLDARVFLSMGVNWVTGEVVASCRRYHRKSIILLASDANLSELYRAGSHERDGYGEFGNACHYAVMNADAIVAQNEKQRDLLKSRFGRDCTVIRNPIALEDELPPANSSSRECALWVGRSDDFHKRPLLCLELAERCPEIQFTMIMNRRDSQIHEEVLKRKGPNVEVVEHVPFTEMPEYYRRAKVFVNTSSSDWEGFPNTLLQAGKYGAPIVSLEVDPDGALSRNGGALVARGDFELLVRQLKEVWHSSRSAADLAGRMRGYLEQYHGIEGRVNELQGVVRRVLNGV